MDQNIYVTFNNLIEYWGDDIFSIQQRARDKDYLAVPIYSNFQ